MALIIVSNHPPWIKEGLDSFSKTFSCRKNALFFGNSAVLTGENRINQSGFTLLEIIVASLIFSLVVVGITSTFVATKKHLVHTKSRIQAFEHARAEFEKSYIHVRQDTWNDSENRLADSFDNVTTGELGPNMNYTCRYMVMNSSSLPGDLRRVDVELTWNETQ